jgi:hypothetical protein
MREKLQVSSLMLLNFILCLSLFSHSFLMAVVLSLLVGKPEEKRPIERPRCWWMDDIKMDLRVVGWGGINWIDLALDRDQWKALVNMAVNIWVLQNVGKFLSSCTTGCFSRRVQLHDVR